MEEFDIPIQNEKRFNDRIRLMKVQIAFDVSNVCEFNQELEKNKIV